MVGYSVLITSSEMSSGPYRLPQVSLSGVPALNKPTSALCAQVQPHVCPDCRLMLVPSLAAIP